MEYAKKINALLAKAASSTHEAERISFTEAAERLMVKWGIDDAMLESASDKANRRRRGEGVERRMYREEGTSAILVARFVATLAAQGVGPIRSAAVINSPVWYAVGYPSDLARVEIYVPQVVDQARESWKRYLKAQGGSSYYYAAQRKSFLVGYGIEVSERLKHMFKEESTSGSELVLANREDNVSSAFGNFFPKTIKSRKSKLSSDAFHAGTWAGERASFAAGSLV